MGGARRRVLSPGGAGDCTIVDGEDGYFYAYCLRARDWRTIVARAALTAYLLALFAGGHAPLGGGGNAHMPVAG